MGIWHRAGSITEADPAERFYDAGTAVSSHSDSAGPVCPRCGRRIAAWRLEHCVYCGAVFPPDFKEGFAEPESLKWVERPPIPTDAARQLEMLRVVELNRGERRRFSPRNLFVLLSVPVLLVLFYVIYRMGYALWNVLKHSP